MKPTEGLGDEEKVIDTVLQLLLKVERDYYQQKKEVVSDEQAFYQKVKTTLKAKHPDFILTDVYKNILLMEKDCEEFLELVKINPALIESTAQTLKAYYEKKTVELYANYLLSYAETLYTQLQYKKLAPKIR